MSVLHEDENLKKVFPSIDVVTRQTANIKRRVMRNRYSSGRGEEVNNNLPQPGNYRLHDQSRCVCCARMEDGLTKVTISKTGRQYEIKCHYTCLDTHVVYLTTCLICQSQYVGQTIKEMRRRHYGHRDEIKRRSDGLGEHFHNHALEMGLDLKIGTEMDRLMQYFHLAVVGSVQPGKPWTQARLDNLESDLQHRFQCLQKHGGIGIRDETRRRRNGQWALAIFFYQLNQSLFMQNLFKYYVLSFILVLLWLYLPRYESFVWRRNCKPVSKANKYIFKTVLCSWFHSLT